VGEPPPDAERYVFDTAIYCENRRARRAQKGIVEWKGVVEKNAATAYPALGVGV
jgi:hypothetical protein